MELTFVGFSRYEKEFEKVNDVFELQVCLSRRVLAYSTTTCF